MAEIQQSDTRKQRGGTRGKKLSTRVDLTPMVDLGFLLITFFIFTTTMSQAKAFKMIVPTDEKPQNESLTPEGKTLSLILEGENVIHYYYGQNIKQMLVTNYSPSGLRAVIMEKIAQVKRKYGVNEQAIILIKPTDHASYKNILAVMDEIQINDVRKYVLMDPSKEEMAL